MAFFDEILKKKFDEILFCMLYFAAISLSAQCAGCSMQ
jgi:hypothetical protein